MNESEVIARSITKLAEAIESLADEMKDFRRDLRSEWLKVVVQTKMPMK